jgi:hypothetical protein
VLLKYHDEATSSRILAVDQKIKLLARTVMNTYFPQVYTVISLPSDNSGRLPGRSISCSQRRRHKPVHAAPICRRCRS